MLSFTHFPSLAWIFKKNLNQIFFQHKWAVKERVILDWTLPILQFQCLNAHRGRKGKTLEKIGKSGKGNLWRAQGAKTIRKEGPFRINV